MSAMTPEKMQVIVEAALMVADQPMTLSALQLLFNEDERPSNPEMKSVLTDLRTRYEDRGIDLQEVASGWRFQAKPEMSPWLSKLWEDRAPRYSRAFLETMAIIAYKQPVTRAEIEEIRGVTVSTNIMKTLQEREWIRVLGYKEVPGRPAIYGTTKDFLDYFNLKSLTELPSLTEFKNLEAQEAQLQVELALENSGVGPDNSEHIPEEREALIQDDIVAETESDNIIPLPETEVEHESVVVEAQAEDEDETVLTEDEEEKEALAQA